MVKSFLKTAWRNIVRHPVFAIINVLGLALGLCFCLVIFLVVRYEFSFDRFHPDGDRIYLVGRTIYIGNNLDSFNASRVMPALPEAMRREVSGLEAVTGFHSGWDPKVKIPGSKSKSGNVEFVSPEGEPWAGTLLVAPDYFSIFHYRWLSGSPAALQRPFQVVISASRAKQYFGDIPLAEVMGRRLIFDDSLSFSVAGVVADWAGHSDFVTKQFVSLSTVSSTRGLNHYPVDNWLQRRGSADIWAFVKLSKGTDPERIRAQIQTLAKANMPQQVRLQMTLLALHNIHFARSYSHDPIRKAHLPTLNGVMALAAFILILAMINFINLSTAQSIRRAREVGVRKVLGSGRAALTLQFLTETLLVVLFAGVLATALVPLVLRLFSDFIPDEVQFTTNGSVLFFLLVISLLTTLLAGYYPARVLSSYLPVISLRGAEEYQGHSSWTLRRGLIVFQFTISLGFIICTLVVGGQMGYMLRADYGFKADAILTVQTNRHDSLRKVEVCQNKLAGLPVVAGVIRESGPPLGWGTFYRPFTGGMIDSAVPTETEYANETFVPFYDIPMLAGRNLHHTDGLQEVLINEAAVRFFGFGDPRKAIGHFMYVGGGGGKKLELPIVGVVADYHTVSFHDAIHPLVIGNAPDEETYVGVRLALAGHGTGDLPKALEAVQKAYKSVYPEEEFQYQFLDESIRDMYENERHLSELVRSAMLVTIFISCMGLFGVSLFVAEKRTKEVSIRRVLGATVSQIVLLLCREFVLLVLLAALIASPIAWWAMYRWLEEFTYRIPLGIPLFLAAGCCGVGIAILTISFQAVRAAISNPVNSLRNE